MNTNKKISIIIPIYKVEEYLHQCVDSVIGQTYENIEIILVDDGSPDNCPQICDEYASKDIRIKVIHKQNGGLASARNAGLDAATGGLISFVDSDDWIEKTMYEEMIQVMDETKSTIVCCEGVQTDGIKEYDVCFTGKPMGTIISGEEATKEILLNTVGSQVVKGLYEKKCWEGVRFPIGMLYEDIPTTYKAFEKADTVSYIDKQFYNYRINPLSISGTPNPVKTYHQFLGFKTHYDCAKEKYPDIFSDVAGLTAQFAISTSFHYYTDATTALEPYINEVEKFLDDNKKNINFTSVVITRRFMLRLYYLSKDLFISLCKFLMKSKLQKLLRLEVK